MARAKHFGSKDLLLLPFAIVIVDTVTLQPSSAARQNDIPDPVNADAGSNRGMLMCALCRCSRCASCGSEICWQDARD